MTKEEYDNIKREIERLVSKCVIESEKSVRELYKTYIINKFEKLEKEYIKTFETFDKQIDLLTTSAKTIQEQNDWIACLRIAMEEQKEDIEHKAAIALKAIKDYKLRKKGDKQ